MKELTYAEYKKMFSKDANGCFIHLVIPANDFFPEMNLSEKDPKTFSIDEIVRIKKYSGEMFSRVDPNTIE